MGRKAFDMTGLRYGQLVAVKRVADRERKEPWWLFNCDCGKTTEAVAAAVRRGDTTSCGCYRDSLVGELAPNFKHGLCLNPEMQNFYKKKSLARRRNAVGEITKAELEEQFAEQQGCCYWCDDPLDSTKQLDHVVPISRGGLHVIENAVWACPPCNRQKHAKLVEEWFLTPDCRAIV